MPFPQASPVADLSKKQVRRTKLIGQQVVWENVPRTQALAKCDWLTLTARHGGGGALNGECFYIQ
ncbi:hypothetical protein HMPREF9081_0706 [Centipeda periodontii DSM 2778]|uniref:Uncharacterized protein n=1 Tax=Centipeda periodontii DSM 2778 TaxID=888060 RepID=F5RKC1_9FIRM|nr:hypothetical protein HMPREF9081_0706 [Centipeda periodontii DSM 2778]